MVRPRPCCPFDLREKGGRSHPRPRGCAQGCPRPPQARGMGGDPGDPAGMWIAPPSVPSSDPDPDLSLRGPTTGAALPARCQPPRRVPTPPLGDSRPAWGRATEGRRSPHPAPHSPRVAVGPDPGKTPPPPPPPPGPGARPVGTLSGAGTGDGAGGADGVGGRCPAGGVRYGHSPSCAGTAGTESSRILRLQAWAMRRLPSASGPRETRKVRSRRCRAGEPQRGPRRG